MFAELAPKLRKRGWGSIIPVIAGLKQPAIAGWKIFNKNPRSNSQIARWARLYGDGGVGLAFGPDHVVGIDLDWLGPGPTARGCEITRSILGSAPLVRIGRPPKRLALYRCIPGLIFEGKVFDGFDLFSLRPVRDVRHSSGDPQTVSLADRYPRNRRADRSAARRQRADRLADCRTRSDRSDNTDKRPRRRSTAGEAGIATEILRALADIKDAPSEVARLLAATPCGKRHNMMVGAALTTAVATRHLCTASSQLRLKGHSSTTI